MYSCTGTVSKVPNAVHCNVMVSFARDGTCIIPEKTFRNVEYIRNLTVHLHEPENTSINTSIRRTQKAPD